MLMTLKKTLCAWLLLCSTVVVADDPKYCAVYPVLYDEETDCYVFYIEEIPVNNGVPDCYNWTARYGWYSSSFSAWPENCPDCSDELLGYYASNNQDRGLKSRLGATQSLCNLAPERHETASGKVVFPRKAITDVKTHDIQMRTLDGERMVSVRLFEAKLVPALGNMPGKERMIRCGFETDQAVSQTIRPFSAQSVSGRQFQATVIYQGKPYAVMTKTPMTKESLATR